MQSEEMPIDELNPEELWGRLGDEQKTQIAEDWVKERASEIAETVTECGDACYRFGTELKKSWEPFRDAAAYALYRAGKIKVQS